MASSAVAVYPRALEDPLDHLPCSQVVLYKKGAVIYNQNHPCSKIYLVITGKVKICQYIAEDCQAVVDIYGTDEFFGESVFLKLRHRSEQATALESTELMFWTAAQIQDLLYKKPKLAVALLQIMVQRTLDLQTRIESFSLHTIPRRLARSLIRFGERFGSQQDDGSLRMAPLTHKLLSQYVGTSREAVTLHMNDFRRQGVLSYSPDSIVFKKDVLTQFAATL